MMKRLIGLGMVVILPHFGNAQFLEEFLNPSLDTDLWDGEESEFEVIDNELRLAEGAASPSYLATNNLGVATDLNSRITEWQFVVKLDFAPSNSNFTRIYLASDQEDLSGNLNGYYIRIGESGSDDGIELYKQLGAIDESVAIVADNSGRAASNPHFLIKVIRDLSGNWEVMVDNLDDEDSFVSIGSGTDNSHTTLNYFGVYAVFTSSRRESFAYDDFAINKAPAITQIETVSNTELDLFFDEEVATISAENTGNYMVDQSIGAPNSAMKDGTESNLVHLTFANAFTGGVTNTLTVNGVEDLYGNATNNVQETFTFLADPLEGDVVINELFPDPTPSVGLPQSEFVELFNRSTQPFDLSGWTLSDGSSTATLSSFLLNPGAYVMLTSTSNVPDFQPFGDVLGVSNFPGLNNGGELITLRDDEGNTIDQVNYTDDWYNDPARSNGGYTLELINPFLPCSGAFNWSASDDSNGGTPGTQNSLFDSTPDEIAPNLVNAIPISPNEIVLVFDEPMDEASLTAGTYTLNEGIAVQSVTIGIDLDSVTLGLSAALTSGNDYIITVNGVSDCSGNALAVNTFNFSFDNEPPSIDRVILVSLERVDLIFNEPVEESTAEDEDNYLLSPLNSNPSSSRLDDLDSTRVQLEFDEEFALESTLTLTVNNIEDLVGNQIMTAEQVEFIVTQDIDSAYVVAPNLLDIKFSQVPSDSTASIIENYFLPDEEVNAQFAFKDLDEPAIVHLGFPINFEENEAIEIQIDGLQNEMGTALITPSVFFVYDTRVPRLNLLEVQSDTQLMLTFDEALTIAEAEAVTNYSLEDDELPSSAELVGNNQVQLIFANSFEQEQEKTLSILGLKDLSGNVITRRINETFLYDTEVPALDSLVVLSTEMLELYFSETLSSSVESTENYFLGTDDLNPLSALRFAGDSAIVTLEFSDPFPETTSLTLKLINMEDARGNTTGNDTIGVTINTFNPQLGRITPISAEQLNFQFSEPIDEGSIDPSNWTINNLNPTNLEIDPGNAQLITANLSEKLEQGETYGYSISGLEDLEGNPTLQVIEGSSIFNTSLAGVNTIGTSIVEMRFEQPLDPDSVQLVSKYMVDQGVGKPAAVILDGESAEILRLIFAQDFESDQVYQLSWERLFNAYQQRIPDFSSTFTLDLTPPQLLAINVLAANELQLVFDEALGEELALALNHYEVDQSLGQPMAVDFDEEQPEQVILIFDQAFDPSLEYQLNLSRLTDRSGNEIDEQVGAFNYVPPNIPLPNQILINEFLADPSPSVQLPEEEFLELYNNSSDTFNLNLLAISDDSRLVQLPNHRLLPGGFVIITDEDNTALFSPSGDVIGLGVFPSLGNSGDSLTLSTSDGIVIIDQLVYDQSWYKDTSKDDGGFTLERTGFGGSCGEFFNWIASESETGGTPGAINSVDGQVIQPPTLQINAVSLVAEDTLLVVFNQVIAESALANAQIQVTDNQVTGFNLPSDPGEEVFLGLGEPITDQGVFTLSIDQLANCAGSVFNSLDVTFGSGGTPNYNELMITEIMSNPTPEVGLPDAEYLEVFNASDRIINLDGVVLSDASSSTTLPSVLLSPEDYLILTPNGDVDDLVAFGRVQGVTSWPSLNNSSDLISLSFNGAFIFAVNYETDWYNDSDKAGGGYSLEMIDTSNPCGASSNWTASNSTDGGTPGNVNSVAANNPDQFGPVVDNVIATNNRELKVRFSEKIDPGDTATLLLSIDPEIGIMGNTLRRPFDNELTVNLSDDLEPRIRYGLTVSRISDCNGNLINEEDGQAFFVLPETAEESDVVVNEILFNPRSGGVDFVELYNRSEKFINLKNWQFANRNEGVLNNQSLITDMDIVMEPGDILVFTEDPSVLIVDYPSGNFESFLETNLPSFPNDEGTVVVLDSLVQVIDEFAYDEDFHFNLLEDVDGVSLERVSVDGTTQDPNNWKSASSTAGFATPGLFNSQARSAEDISGTFSIDPQVFVPNNDGIDDFTTIFYRFDQPGNFGSISIFDTSGRLVKSLIRDELLALEGFVTWDGTNESFEKSNIGYYLVLFEVFNSNGRAETFKETVVVGARF